MSSSSRAGSLLELDLQPNDRIIINPNQSTIEHTVAHGKFYYPAWKHYGRASAAVVCDSCQRPNLAACIGYDNCDVCLRCADNLTQNQINGGIPACRSPSSYKPPVMLSCPSVNYANYTNYADLPPTLESVDETDPPTAF